MDQTTPSRRQFLTAVGNLASVGWVTLNWPQIAAAADMASDMAGHQHAHHSQTDGPAPPTTIKTLTAAEAADVDAIADQIVPGGAMPGARDARVLYFIDNALGSFFADQLPAFRKGLVAFQEGYAAQSGAGQTFAGASPEAKVSWLKQVDKTPFFLAVRRLTVLGLIAMPRYGGNRDMLGWKLLGVEDNHVWEPPFGYYDKDYPGFDPYPGTKPYTA